MPQSTIFPEPREYPDDAADAAMAEQDNIERNISSLIAIPWEQCPWPAVRSKLLRIAIEGAPIYAYTPFGSKEYVIYQWPAEPWMLCRFSPRDWAIKQGYDVPGPATTAESKEGV
jgi:hypothetical protein